MGNNAKKSLSDFEDLPAVVEEIDNLLSTADKVKGRKEKKELLFTAQKLADQYEKHCRSNGNLTNQFKSFL